MFDFSPVCIDCDVLIYLPSMSPQTSGPPLPGTNSLVSAPERYWSIGTLVYWYIGCGIGDPSPLNNMKTWRDCKYQAIEHLPEFPAIYLITRTSGDVGMLEHVIIVAFLHVNCEMLCVALIMLYQFTITAVTPWHRAEWKSVVVVGNVKSSCRCCGTW